MSSRQNKSRFNPSVFYPSSALILVLVFFATLFPKTADILFKTMQNSITQNGSWFYILTVATILLIVVFLGMSRYGEIKLGLDHSTPDYSYTTWFAMLFSAGMGIGLMFFGVAEPVMHFLSPPIGESGTVESAKQAMRITFFHWGLHGWAIYAVVAIILAFFSYRHNLPLTLRSALYPIIGDKIYGKIGDAVDIFAVIGTVFGVATSLGYGVLQVNTGLNHLLGVPATTNIQVVLIIAITALATLSVVTGLDKGIKRLSELNMGLALFLLVFILVLGNTAFLLKTLVQNTGEYVSSIVQSTFNLYAYQKTNWMGGWTLFYWAWWIAWSPFVGLFIARISKGRTIREFVFGVLFVPTGFILLWMTFFGSSAINIIFDQGITSLGDIVSKDVSMALYAFLEHFPLSTLLSYIATLMIVVFFVTSADSGAMVIDMLCSRGRDDTPLWQKIYWAAGVGVIAIVLLLAGGLDALQTMTIVSALPFSIVLLVAIYGLIKALRIDLAKRDSLMFNSTQVSAPSLTGDWKERLSNIIDYPNRRNVNKFIANSIKSAMDDIAGELRDKEYKVNINQPAENSIVFEVELGEEMNFLYKVQANSYVKPSFSQDDGVSSSQRPEEELYFRAEVYLKEGGQDYDIMGWSKPAIRNDIIEQYQKHMHFLHLLN